MKISITINTSSLGNKYLYHRSFARQTAQRIKHPIRATVSLVKDLTKNA